MNRKNRVIKAIKNPGWLCGVILRRVLSPMLSDKTFIKWEYFFGIGRFPNLKNPQTFNEKLQWLKLYDRRPIYTQMVDKYAAKEYVASIIGEEYIIPTLGVWEKPEDIEWDKLPNQFVLKVSHDSGGLVICRDKSKLDKKAAIAKINKSLKTDYYKVHREWPYKDVPRRVIAEQYMEDNKTKELRDYKFFCMDEVCKALFIATERQRREEPYFDFFDTSFKHLDIRQGHPNAPQPPEKPENFELMVKFAEKLSKGLPEARIDFYEVNGKAYFGEITLFHFSGNVPFNPPEVDFEWGKWITLPNEWGGVS